jgi:hypothetical protein
VPGCRLAEASLWKKQGPQQVMVGICPIHQGGCPTPGL